MAVATAVCAEILNSFAASHVSSATRRLSPPLGNFFRRQAAN